MATKKDKAYLQQFEELDFDGFKNLAKNNKLSKYEKIGFPDEYRKGYEEAIFADILTKLGLNTESNVAGKTYVDIGPGCSDLPFMLIDFFKTKKVNIVLCDSAEMLDLLPKGKNIKKEEGYFPNIKGLEKYNNKADYVVSYSVFHYIAFSSCIYKFIDTALNMLNHGGIFLIGDIPNFSKRKRFFASPAGITYHQNYTQSKTLPKVDFNTLDNGKIDDGMLLGIIARYRNAGYDVYLLPQASNLPMTNRREDIVIYKP